MREAVADLDRVLSEVGDRAAGVVIEPLIQGASGILEHPVGYLREVRRLATQHGVPLIADEVAVGFARTGTMFACESESVTPDILCLGKGISGGYLPLAATLVRDEIARSFDGDEGEYRTLFHGHTYTGNPLACAVALASLELLQANGTVAHAGRIGDLMRMTLAERLSDHPNVGDLRGRGVMTGIELVQKRTPHTPFARSRRVAYGVCDAARGMGAIVRPLGDTLVLNPAPAMDEATAFELCEITARAVEGFDLDAS